MMNKSKLGRKSSITPVSDTCGRGEDFECMIMEEKSNIPLHQRIQDAAITAWTGDNAAVIISDILGPHAQKEWNLPVGSHKNPFWKFTKTVSSPTEIKRMLTKSLTVTCSMGSAPLVKNLLEAGGDPNGEQGKWGPLHSAAYTGNVEVMRVLLDDIRTNINSTEDKGKTALHIAAKKGNYEVLKMLLNKNKINVNIIDESGSTALHVAGSSPLLGEVPTGRFLQCITLLMDKSDVKLNIPDKEGLTPLAQTVTLYRKEMVKAMLKHNKGKYLNVDYFLVSTYGTTIREALTHTYPELTSELPNPPQEKLDAVATANRLLAYLQKGDFNSFQSLLKNTKQPLNLHHWYDEPYHCTIIEIACQIKNRQKFIIALLNAGANPNTVNRLTSQSLLHLASKTGNTEALKILLQVRNIDVNIKDCYSRTPLHCLSGIHSQNKNNSAALQNTINMLLGDSSSDMDNRKKSDLNAVTLNGETPLHIAARIGEKDTILTLFRHGANIMFRTADIKPPIMYIDPAILESYLDECIESNEYSSTQDDYMLTFDYSFLYLTKQNPQNCDDKNRKREPEMETLQFLSKKHRFKQLLKHPIISSYLQLKWQKVRLVYVITFLFYSMFLGVLTWHSILPDREHGSDDTNFQLTISLYILATILLIMCFGQIYQFLQSPKTYLTHSSNWLLWVVIFITMNVCMDKVVTIIPECPSIALLLAWTHFVALIGGFPKLSIQLEMLKTVSWTFFTFIICYCPLFLAFGICFYTMFRYSGSEEDEFFSVSLGMSMLKTFIMFAGEFEASDIPFEAAKITSHITFTIFVFLLSIVLLNLLNGLAVSDTQAIRKDAEILSLAARIRVIHYIEKMSCSKITYMSILNKMKDRKLRIFPNRKTGRIEVNGMTYKNKSIDEDILQNAIGIAEMKKSTISDESGDEKLSNMQRKLSAVEKHQEDMNKKINEISKQLNSLHQASNDVNVKLNEILASIGSHSSKR